ncbi:MAG TPA: rhomboid family intramembrane serine protease [Ktedonobacterales bacterium]
MEQQTSTQAQIARGDTLLKQGDVREAAETFANVVRAEPNNPAGHLGLAEASLALGDFTTTQQACAQVQQLAPQGAEAALSRALQAVLNQRFDLALQEVDHSIELDPTLGYAHALRAFVLRRLGQRYDGALAEARAGRIWGTRDLDHLFASIPKPELAATPTVAAGSQLAPQIPTTPGPRPWDQRPAYQRRMVRTRFTFRGVPVVTYTLMAINIGIFVIGLFFGGNLNNTPGRLFAYTGSQIFAGADNPIYGFGMAQGLLILHDPIQAYRILTSMFLHESIVHVGANMLSLFFVGVIVERLFGSGRFTIIYFASGIVAGVAQILLAPANPTLGASGAIFGIFGAFGAFLLMRRRALGPAVNAMLGQWIFWLSINLFISFSVPGIGVWAHLGGLVAGFLLGALMTSMATRQRSRPSY